MRSHKVILVLLNSLLIAFLQFTHAAETINASVRSTDTFPLIYEAEDGTYNDLSLVSGSTASNGKFLKMGTSGSVAWNVILSEAGWYNLKFRYQSSEGEKVNILIKNQVNWLMGFGWTNNWAMIERLVALNAGANTIELACNMGGIDIDYLMIDTMTVVPAITPTNNVYYLKTPRDIFIKVNTYGREITAISANNSPLTFNVTSYSFEEDAWLVQIDSISLSALPAGEQDIFIEYDTGESSVMRLDVMSERTPSILTIIAPHVDHGNAVLFILPTGKTMLVDCGTAAWRDKVVIPLLINNCISKLDYFIITHYHEDHDSGDQGATIRTQFNVEHFYDYHSFVAGDILNMEEVQLKIFNAYDNGSDENSRSLSFQLKYNDFIYVHGADTYASNQQAIMSKFPNDLKAHVFSANHHFHGSTDSNYMRAMDPCIVITQAQEAIYARSAYAMVYLINTVKWLKENHKRFMDNLPSLEVGTTVIRVNSEDDWSYETYKDTEAPLVPFIPLNMHLFEDQINPPVFIQQPEENISTYEKEVNLEFVTNKTAYLRYSEVDQSYDQMPHEFPIGQGLIFHKTTIAGEQGQEKKYYFRAIDRYGNETTNSVMITIETDTLSKPMYWNQLEYPDSSWKTGYAPLGYGNSTDQTTVNTVKTLYLRKAFFVTDSIDALNFFLMGHDGIVAYLNGEEIIRLNMPSGTTGYDTYAESAPSGLLSKWLELSSKMLQHVQIGTNTLALEVHQADVSNPTISADARVFNSNQIYSDLRSFWYYYDDGNEPPMMTWGELTHVSEYHNIDMPEHIELFPNYPNPFNGSTTIKYSLSKSAHVKLAIYNLLGQELKTLVNSNQFAGDNSVIWKGLNDSGVMISSGIYVCKLMAGDYVQERKIILLK